MEGKQYHALIINVNLLENRAFYQGEAKAHPSYTVLHEQVKNAAKYRVTPCISLSLELNIR